MILAAVIEECAEYSQSVHTLNYPPTLYPNRPPVNVSLCAIKSQKLIVGSTKAERKEFPHTAAVGFTMKNGDIVWSCGGTLISKSFTLSAAHCTYSPDWKTRGRNLILLITNSIEEKKLYCSCQSLLNIHQSMSCLELKAFDIIGVRMQWFLFGKAMVLLMLRPTDVFSAGEKSKEKCKEYAKHVYAEEAAPVLRMNAGTNSVSHCGIVEVPLIVGGTKAARKEFPHMALIGFGNSEEEVSWQCGGSLISENFVLTASHCLESQDNGPAIKVRIGLTNQKKPGDTMQERKISERIKHPNYAPPARYHDIALIKLDKPFDLNAEVRPACLHDEEHLPGTKAIASGFGKLSYEESSGSDDLMKVQLTYIPDNECKETFKTDIGGKQLPDGLIPNLICAGEMGGGKDTCQGDSGGPLQRVLTEPYCMYSIVGVTSFGKFCGFENSPAIYSRVSSYLDWIESTVWP